MINENKIESYSRELRKLEADYAKLRAFYSEFIPEECNEAILFDFGQFVINDMEERRKFGVSNHDRFHSWRVNAAHNSDYHLVARAGIFAFPEIYHEYHAMLVVISNLPKDDEEVVRALEAIGLEEKLKTLNQKALEHLGWFGFELKPEEI